MTADAGPVAAPKRRAHYPEVDALRAFAALGVILAHTLILPYFNAPHSAAGQYLDGQSSGVPRTAALVFFAISGLVLYRPFVVARYRDRPTPSIPAWWVRRAARIAPAYWLALAVAGIVIGYHYLITPSGFFRYFGFAQIYGNIETLGGGLSVAWTLCVEVTFYLAMPLIVLAARGIGRYCSRLVSELITCAGLLAISVLWQVEVIKHVHFSTGWQVPVLTWLPGCIGMIAAGMVLAVLSVEVQYRERPHPVMAAINRWPGAAWIVALVMLYFEAKLPAMGEAKLWVTGNLIKLVASALLIAPFVLGDADGGVVRRMMRSRVLVWVGTVSYGIYLWHDPLLIEIGPHINSAGPVVTVIAVFCGALVLGALSYYCVEVPSQNLAKRWNARRAARRAGGGAPEAAGAYAAEAMTARGEPMTALGVPIIGPAVAEAAAAHAIRDAPPEWTRPRRRAPRRTA